MDIELLYFDGCPNWQLARDRLAEALAATGNAGTPIRLRRIETPEAAERAAFAGSPTIRIDGIDPFGPTEGVGLTCRVYRNRRRTRRRPEHRGADRRAPPGRRSAGLSRCRA